MGDTALACFGRIPWIDCQGVRRARQRQSDDVDDDGDNGNSYGRDANDRDGGNDGDNDEGDIDGNVGGDDNYDNNDVNNDKFLFLGFFFEEIFHFAKTTEFSRKGAGEPIMFQEIPRRTAATEVSVWWCRCLFQRLPECSSPDY